jgi:hypothetical protein
VAVGISPKLALRAGYGMKDDPSRPAVLKTLDTLATLNRVPAAPAAFRIDQPIQNRG